MRALTLILVGLLSLLSAGSAVRDQQPMVAQESKLPPDHYCTPPKKDLPPRAHACDCQRECGEEEDGKTVIHEDPQCKSYCTASACRCPMHNCP